jgi:hypothetical protein
VRGIGVVFQRENQSNQATPRGEWPSKFAYHRCSLCVRSEFVNEFHHVLSLALICLILSHCILHLFMFQFHVRVKVASVVYGTEVGGNGQGTRLSASLVTFPHEGCRIQNARTNRCLEIRNVQVNFLSLNSIISVHTSLRNPLS